MMDRIDRGDHTTHGKLGDFRAVVTDAGVRRVDVMMLRLAGSEDAVNVVRAVQSLNPLAGGGFKRQVDEFIPEVAVAQALADGAQPIRPFGMRRPGFVFKETIAIDEAGGH